MAHEVIRHEVIVAIVAGIAAILSAVITTIQAVRTARYRVDTDLTLEKIRAETSTALAKITSEGNEALEEFKAENERRMKAFDIASQESAPIEAALGQAWEDIQVIKDEISKIISPERYDLDLAFGPIKAAVTSLTENYSNWGSSLPDDARTTWHGLKGSASATQMIIERCVSPQGEVAQPLDDMAELLRETRLSLTDKQLALSAAQQTIRATRARKILEVLSWDHRRVS